MLIDFKVSNWMSFRDDTQFSMQGTEITVHRERLSKIDKSDSTILPVSMIFGANASGKSNFVKAIQFAQNLIVYGTRPEQFIDTMPFLLDGNESKIKFEFVILIDEKIYEYSFVVDQDLIYEEKLTRFFREEETVLYQREFSKKKIKFADSVIKESKGGKAFLEFIALGARVNQLFLTNSISQDETLFKPIYDWFDKSLLVIRPDTYLPSRDLYIDSIHSYRDMMNEAIPKLDFGISSLQSVEVPYDDLPVPVAHWLRRFPKDKASLQRRYGENYYVAFRESGEIKVYLLEPSHTNSSGKEIQFEFSQESDGTRRVIDLLPIFYNLIEQNRVLVIDEVDRSVHPILIKRILESYLENCNPQKRSQLIFSTHSVELLDEKLFRADEIWVTEKKSDGSSILRSLCEFEGIQTVENLQEEYLEGRYGGIPSIQTGGIFDLPNKISTLKG